MEIHALQGDECTHVLTIHRDAGDEGPVQLVSAAQVAHWMQREVDYDALMARLEGESDPQK